MNKLGIGAIMLLALTAVGGEVADRKMVWAHHTPWHTPLNSSISAVSYYNYPLCDSSGNSGEDWKREFAQAKAQGIDGFFPDLVAQSNGGKTAFVDAMHGMLKAAEGTDFQIGVCLDVKTHVAQQVKELKAMLDLFGNHPNYPRWKGRPVVNFYTYMNWTPEELTEIRQQMKAAGYDIFVVGNIGISYGKIDVEKFRKYFALSDMQYSFGFDELNGVPMKEKSELYEKLANETNVDRMSTVYPGYYGAWLNGRNDFYQVHDGFDHFHRSFELAMSPRAKWLHFTTWNDHDETSVMPMVFTPGNALITLAYAKKFRGESTVTGISEVLFAYHREELPGTLLRFEAMTLPTVKSGTVEVSGRLLSPDGKEVAKLELKRLKASDFDRSEWLVPSTGLGKYPALTPEFSIKAPGLEKTVRLPEMYLVSGWHQNAVTVKIAACQIVNDVQSKLTGAWKDGMLHAAMSFSAPDKIKQVTLWRNDRPLALFDPQTNGKQLFNLFIKGKVDYTLTVENGKIVQAVRRHGSNLKYDDKSFTSKSNQDWAPAALCLAGSKDLKINFKIAGADPLTITAEELAQREKINYSGMDIERLPVDATLQNRAALNAANGNFELGIFSPEPRAYDHFQLRFETLDNRVAWSAPIYPFAANAVPFPAKVLETATNLETPSGATGCPGHNEYLTQDVPFRNPTVCDTLISPLGIRGGYWDFENGGTDRLGDMPVNIPEAMQNNGSLQFTGKESVTMRHRTYPVGAMTLELKLNPDAGRKSKQSIVTRAGWSEAVELFLLPDGRLEVGRSGNNTIKKETVISKNAIPSQAWSRVRITFDNAMIRIYINDHLDSEFKVASGRSYGNCKWTLGQGYTGKLDDLKVLGAAFAPGDANDPKAASGRKFKPLRADNTPAADITTAVKGLWKFPDNLEKRDGDPATVSFPTERLKTPVMVGNKTLLLGPGENTITAPAEGITLTEGCMISVPLLRFDRAAPQKAWYAVVISVVNDQDKSFSFNLGSNQTMMITANEPKWIIKTGKFPIKLPVELNLAKLNGQLVFMIGNKVVYKTPDENYTKLLFLTSSPNREDATVLQIGEPICYRLKKD